MKKYCVIGQSLIHSMSPEIHSYFGISYSKREVKPCDLQEFVKSREFNGYNVTVPYKKDILPYLSQIDSLAKSIGAVNTVVDDNGVLKGYNTDFGGMKYAINRANIKVFDKVCAILGTGGTMLTATCVLKELGAKSILVVGRTSDINYQNVYSHQEIQVIINTTPVGTFPNTDDTPIDIQKFSKLEGVFDVVYNPLTTKLIEQARKMDIACSNGLAMLVEQARLAENLFGNALAQQTTEEVLDNLLKSKRNIVLIGMPGCGKTTIAKELSIIKNMPLIDTDAEISKIIGDIPSFIKTYGEVAFREQESRIINEVCKNLGCIISMGGGAVLNDNFKKMFNNGFVVYIKRQLSELALSNRPLTIEKGVERLFMERKSLYEQANFSIENNKRPHLIAKEIIEYYEKHTTY